MKPPITVPSDPNTWPPRISGPLVCALAGYSKSTLAKRIAAGRMPKPVDRGRDGLIFNRDEVLLALGLMRAPVADPGVDHDPWDFEPGEINRHLAELKERIRRVARGSG